jgi:MFS family permease
MVATASTVGAIAGTVVAGRLADVFGRRTTLLVTSCFSLIGSVVSAYSSSFPFILIGRLISGLGIGHYSTIVPIYIAECAEPKKRGALATVPQLMVIVHP